MNSFVKFIFSSFLILTINSCCPEVDCVSVLNGPQIKLTLTNFDASDIQKSKIYFTKSLSYEIVDSSDIEVDGVIIVNDAFIPSYSEEVVNLKKYAFIIKTPFTKDTIHKINFNTTTDEINCSPCSLAGGLVDVSSINNFEMEHERIIYSVDDTINISK